MGDREDIEILDSKIARLKVEYEQYFMKVLKREPQKLRDEIEKTILLYSNKTITNTSLKFRYNSTVSKYNSYKQYWTRVLRSIEDGTYVRKAESAPAQAVSKPKQVDGERKEQVRAAGLVEKEANGLSDVYSRYIEARKECKEPTEGITLEGLAKTIEQYKKKVEEQYKTKDVDLKVYIKDGKAKLAITPKKAAS